MDQTLQNIQNTVIHSLLYYSLLCINRVSDTWSFTKDFLGRTWQGAVDAHLNRYYVFLDRNHYPIIVKGEVDGPNELVYDVENSLVIGPMAPKKFDIVLAQLKDTRSQRTWDMSFFFNTFQFQKRMSLLEMVLIFCLQESLFIPVAELKRDYRLEVLDSEAQTLVNELEEVNFTVWPALKEEGEILSDTQG